MKHNPTMNLQATNQSDNLRATAHSTCENNPEENNDDDFITTVNVNMALQKLQFEKNKKKSSSSNEKMNVIEIFQHQEESRDVGKFINCEQTKSCIMNKTIKTDNDENGYKIGRCPINWNQLEERLKYGPDQKWTQRRDMETDRKYKAHSAEVKSEWNSLDCYMAHANFNVPYYVNENGFKTAVAVEKLDEDTLL